ncbi:MAG: DUF427 domain-containing protein [Kofleriaceae bacterium]
MSDRVQLQPIKRLHVRLGGVTVVDTAAAYVVRETGVPPRYYAPRREVRATLEDTAEVGSCPWKGQWRHLDVTVEGTRVPAGAWTYDATTPVCEPIQGYVSFYAQKFDAIEVEV